MPPFLIEVPGYATGDMFGIAASLILNPDARALITREASGPLRDPTDRGDSIHQFVVDSLGGPMAAAPRVGLVQVNSIRARATALTEPSKTNYETEVRRLLGLPGGTNVNSTANKKKRKGVGEGTNVIAALDWVANGDAYRTQLRDAWSCGVADRRDLHVQRWLASRGIPSSGATMAILWSRFSGKKGDIHLEHDTSFEGMRQMAALALKTNEVVLIAGDPPIKERQAGKYDDIARIYAGRVFNVTAFWAEDSDLRRNWSDTRTGQFRLYDYLHRNYGDVRHLGFRSGNLEAMALLGFRVRYLEEPGSMGGDRMAKWHGKAIGYERILVERPPTRSGKFLIDELARVGDAGYAANKRPAWAPGRRDATPKPDDIQGYEKGYTDNDRREGGPIDLYLNPGGRKQLPTMSFRDALELRRRVEERVHPPLSVVGGGGGMLVPVQAAPKLLSVERLEVMFDLSSILDNVEMNTPWTQIRMSYRKWALRNHTDKVGQSEEEQEKAKKTFQDLRELMSRLQKIDEDIEAGKKVSTPQPQGLLTYL